MENTSVNIKVLCRKCMLCKKEHYVEMTPEQYIRYKWCEEGSTQQNIQDVLPELSAGNRELLITGICETCFDSMGNGDD